MTGNRGAGDDWVYRIAALVLPAAVFFVTLRVCRELLAWEAARRR